MTADEFVEGLKSIEVETDLLKSKGFPDDFIEDRKRSFSATPSGRDCLSKHPVVELVENYDCSNLEIGMITFDERIEETKDYLYFGRFEADDLAIDVVTGNVVMLEYGLDHILYDCAQNDASFLSAIFNVAVFIQKNSLEKELYNDEQLNIQMAEEFGDIAGGEKYYDFYKMMLGV